jgi:hypothetical protein
MDSGFTEFFTQLPSVFIFIFCGSGVVLLGVIGYLIAYRRQKANAAPSPSAGQPATLSDLPDLDSLLDAPVGGAPIVAQSAPPPPVQVPPPPAPKARAGTFSVTLADGARVEAAEVLSVLRDVADGGLIVQIGDKAYRHPVTGADEAFTRRYANAIRDLTAGSTPRATLPVSSAPAVSPPPAVIPTPPPPNPAVGQPAYADDLPEIDLELPEPDLFDLPPPTFAPKPVSGTPRATTEIMPTAPLPGDLPKFRMPERVEPPKRGRRNAPDRTPVPEINIAAAIEAYLQHKLVMSPLAHRSLHVRSAPGGGVVIEVDGVFYDSVGEVADSEARAFIAAAIEEWQSRQ